MGTHRGRHDPHITGCTAGPDARRRDRVVTAVVPESGRPADRPGSPPEHLISGSRAEGLVRRKLIAHGLVHVHSNFRCRAGELDLVMRDDDCIVIVEVRYRRTVSHGGALGSVSRRKQQRIIQATRYLLRRYPALAGYALRFDVVAVSGPLHSATIDWRRRAFDCSPV
ncbi:MAG: YraN family protein [Gammaproteobacteria bacterium]|nr:YraN family protein [Gammaproteobacteria bacterium]